MVVKSYAGGSLGSWARERVGLSVAGSVGVAPRLLATAADPPLVVMEDLGTASDVAEHLLGSDPLTADDALLAWARALGTLHARTHADRAAIATAFAEAEGAVLDEPVDRFHAGVAGSTDQATQGLGGRRRGARHRRPSGRGRPGSRARRPRAPRTQPGGRLPGQQPPPARRLPPHRLRVGGGAPSRVGRGVPRRPVADLLVLVADPGRVGRAGARRLPRAAVEGIPYVASDAFAHDVEAARAVWALVSVSWSLRTALREEQTPHPASPGTRPRMQHRLALVAESGTAAAAFAGEVLEHTRRQWGDLALALAPAYR